MVESTATWKACGRAVGSIGAAPQGSDGKGKVGSTTALLALRMRPGNCMGSGVYDMASSFSYFQFTVMCLGFLGRSGHVHLKRGMAVSKSAAAEEEASLGSPRRR
ncbi:hypothetical protein M0R45_006628 [Rubus argutus]|uniref:Uncharacterized protein n=1 Tax=Rubus argutus TaxID=59490 RepID=A0AAW1YR46_RUBAR